MKIQMKELMYLAIIGAANEANFAKSIGDEKNNARFSKIMNAIAHAERIEDIIENPT